MQPEGESLSAFSILGTSFSSCEWERFCHTFSLKG
jgi:hypothetical protein